LPRPRESALESWFCLLCDLVSVAKSMLGPSIFPAMNASLNGASAVLLVTAHRMIQRGRVAAHRRLMLIAVATSTLFLIDYLYYHLHVVHGSVHFHGRGWSRPLYFTILISHTILAAAIVPLVIITLSRALRERFDRHRAIARWTYPIWLYVSVTGVLIYFMLYHLFAG
jgi:protein SCO1/2/putative membrane protein